MNLCLSVSLFICLSVCPVCLSHSVCLSILQVYLSVYVSVWPFICLLVGLSICLLIRLSICSCVRPSVSVCSARYPLTDLVTNLFLRTGYSFRETRQLSGLRIRYNERLLEKRTREAFGIYSYRHASKRPLPRLWHASRFRIWGRTRAKRGSKRRRRELVIRYIAIQVIGEGEGEEEDTAVAAKTGFKHLESWAMCVFKLFNYYCNILLPLVEVASP